MRKGKVTVASAMELASDLLDTVSDLVRDVTTRETKDEDFTAAEDLIRDMIDYAGDMKPEKFTDVLRVMDLLYRSFTPKGMDKIYNAILVSDASSKEISSAVLTAMKPLARKYGKKIVKRGRGKKCYGTHR